MLRCQTWEIKVWEIRCILWEIKSRNTRNLRDWSLRFIVHSIRIPGCRQNIPFFEKKNYLFILRERERKWGWGAGGIPSRLRAVSAEPEAGLDPMNHEIMTWAEMKSQILNWLSHPSAPRIHGFNSYFTCNKLGDMWLAHSYRAELHYRWDMFILKQVLTECLVYPKPRFPVLGNLLSWNSHFCWGKTYNKAIINKCILYKGWKVLWRKLAGSGDTGWWKMSGTSILMR